MSKKLFEITVGHAAPKDFKTFTAGYVIAESDEAVYEWIANDAELNGNHLYTSWKDKEEEGEDFEIYDDKYNLIGTEKYKEKIIRLKGEINDEDVDFQDAYYGITLYGWQLVSESIDGLEKAIELKIITVI